MSSTAPIPEPRPPAGRLLWGGGFFLLAWVMPAFIPLVLALPLSTEAKAALSGFLLLGLPEIATLVAVAILGKSGFAWLKARIFRLLRRAAPSAHVGRTRYVTGLAILVILLVMGTVEPYVADLIPWLAAHRRLAIGIADLLFVANLFVLGGDFWDKLRSLFSYEARAQFPA